MFWPKTCKSVNILGRFAVRSLAILSLFAVLPSFAQVQWGGVRGTVSDPSGAMIPGRVRRRDQ